MTRTKDERLGVLVGENVGGGEAFVTVLKAGCKYRIRYAGEDHLCHSSVRDIAGVEREALLVFNIRSCKFHPS